VGTPISPLTKSYPGLPPGPNSELVWPPSPAAHMSVARTTGLTERCVIDRAVRLVLSGFSACIWGGSFSGRDRRRWRAQIPGTVTKTLYRVTNSTSSSCLNSPRNENRGQDSDCAGPARGRVESRPLGSRPGARMSPVGVIRDNSVARSTARCRARFVGGQGHCERSATC
jgi:hypothetical protein